MSKIIFEFQGGASDGVRIEGGENRSLSTVQRDPVLRYWFATKCGIPGERLQVADETYEVKDRIYHDDHVAVLARLVIADKSDQACVPAPQRTS